MKRSKSIDILRAVAVFLVLGRHMEVAPRSSEVPYLLHWLSFHWERGGWVGVELFFVLSGFLVSGLLYKEYNRFGDISAKNFLIRRGLKIYPAFWALLLLTPLVRTFGHPVVWKTMVPEVLFLQNYWPGVWNHTWSLAVEEHFYVLLLLLFIFLTGRKRASPGFSAIPSIFLCLGLVELCLRVLTYRHLPYNHSTHLAPTHLRLDSLFCGVAVAYFYHRDTPTFLNRARRWRGICLLAGMLALAPAFLWTLSSTRPSSPWA
ncbi:MAG: acyltransferase [Pirellulales bacterium]